MLASQTHRRSKPGKIRLRTLVLYGFISLYALMCLYPIVFCILSSLKTNAEIFSTPYGLPAKPIFENYVNAWRIGNIGRYFVNTMYVTVATILLTGLVSTMAAYVLSKMRFRGMRIIYILFVTGLMVPMQSTIIPLAYGIGRTNLGDSYTLLILLYTAFSIPMAVFILTGFMKSIPLSLEEAAIIDGCNHLGVYRHIILPMSTPALASVSIFNFILAWNNLLFPLIFIRDSSKSVISIGLLSFFAEKTSDFGGVMAGAAITIIPPMVAYILLQEKVEKGFAAGAVKG